MSELSEISVITPVFNANKFVQSSVQVMEPFLRAGVEWVIVDDCSSDNSVDMYLEALSAAGLTEVGGVRVCIERLSINQGPVGARNVGLKRASGRYVAFLDVDDVWLPGKLGAQLSYMRSHRSAFSFMDYRHMSYDGRFLGGKIVGSERIDFSLHHRTRGIGCLTVMLDREVIGNFEFPSVPRGVIAEDFLAWASVLKLGIEAQRIPLDMARYRVSNASRSASKIRAAVSAWHIYRDIERIPLFRAAMWFGEYAIRSSFKHVRGPSIPRRDVDGEFSTIGVIV